MRPHRGATPGMHTPYSKLGILGGIGAVASAEFHQRFLVHWAQQNPVRDDWSYPCILHLSAPLPGLTPLGVEHPEQARQALAERLKVLADWGAQAVALACNSLHPLREACEAACGLRIIDPWQAALPTLARFKEPVAILGSRSLQAHLKEHGAAKTLPSRCLLLLEHEHRLVDNVIAQVLQARLPQAATLLEHLLGSLQQREPELRHVVLACSELSVAKRLLETLGPDRTPVASRQSLAFLDTLDCLVQESVRCLGP